MKKAIKATYQAKCEKRNRYPDWRGNWRGNQKYEVVKIVKRKIKTNQYITGKEIIIRNNGDVLTFCYKCKKMQKKIS